MKNFLIKFSLFSAIALFTFFSFCACSPKGNGADENTETLLEMTLNDDESGYTVSSVIKSGGKELTIPETYNGKPVTAIGKEAFLESEFEYIALPNTVKSIEKNAFKFSKRLEIIITGHGVETIGEGAFMHCRLLTDIILPDSLVSIGKEAFRDCEFLTTVSLGGTKELGEGAFYNCQRLELVAPAKNLVSIGDRAFENCIRLYSIALQYNNSPTSLESIGNYAFSGCKALKGTQITDSVKTVGEGAYYNCIGITDVNLSNVVSLGKSAFNSCTLLESVVIGDAVQFIGESAFFGCLNLVSVEGEISLLSIERGTFYGCEKLGAIDIGKSVVSIADNAFYDCKNLTDVRYGGNDEDWVKITIGIGNKQLTEAYENN